MHAVADPQAVFYLFILLKAQKRFLFNFLLKKLSQPCNVRYTFICFYLLYSLPDWQIQIQIPP